MKEQIAQLIASAVDALKADGTLPGDTQPNIMVENTRDKSHGDFASNIALTLAKPARRNPRELAQALLAALPQSDLIEKTELAGPGFINFFVTQASTAAVVEQILTEQAAFGRGRAASKARTQVEFVSANPTGPLHVGHGRGAAYGASVADLLEAAGVPVEREYYVNDAGRQMNILGTSVWLRYLEKCGAELTFPSNGYKGAYIHDIAAAIFDQHGDQYNRPLADVNADIPADEPQGGDKEIHIDALIERAKALLGDAGYGIFFNAALDSILADIQDDLSGFGVDYQQWFSELSLTSNGDVDGALNTLQENGYLFEKDGNLWFRSTDFGDDKDRVVRRANGATTYFASDIAYLKNKFERGFDKILYIWGADHHGYIARMKAACQALGYAPERLMVRLVQFAILYRGEERLAMSTRSGSFVTLRELREEVGNDACRFFYVTRKAEQHMDFDLELAKSESKDNPVYYIQYAHARICSVQRKLKESDSDWAWDKEAGLANLALLNTEHEKDLITKLSKYPEVLTAAAEGYEPHMLANYLRELANDFHSYYNANKMLIEEAELRNARVTLSEAARQVLHNGLTLLGVNAPEQM